MSQPTLFDTPKLRPQLATSLVSQVRPAGLSAASSLDEQFEAFHTANPAVYLALRDLARDLVRRGRRRIGIKMLFEVLRWQVQMTTTDPDSDFKLNNSYCSRYARHLMEGEPELAGVFELREMKA